MAVRRTEIGTDTTRSSGRSPRRRSTAATAPVTDARTRSLSVQPLRCASCSRGGSGTWATVSRLLFPVGRFSEVRAASLGRLVEMPSSRRPSRPARRRSGSF